MAQVLLEAHLRRVGSIQERPEHASTGSSQTYEQQQSKASCVDVLSALRNGQAYSAVAACLFRFILRNHLIQEAIEKAEIDLNDDSRILLKLSEHTYSDQPLSVILSEIAVDKDMLESKTLNHSSAKEAISQTR